VIAEGLLACEALVRDGPGPFLFGTAPTLADLCLVPQLFNARRFGTPLDALPRLLGAEAACLALPAFADTAPEKQPDAE
jgi:maleylpyruvate isomerase